MEFNNRNMNVIFKAKKINSNDWVSGFFTKKKIGNLFVPVIETIKEWDTGDYIESYEIDADSLTDVL